MNQRIPCAAGLAVIVLAGAPAFAADTRDVRVVNTPAEAIPVNATGTVALAPGTQVGVAGPVSLTPGTEVGVANTAGTPLHVVASAAVPNVFVRSANILFDENSNDGHAFITVPPGKRWVIEQFGARLEDAAGLTVDFTIRPSSLGVGGRDFFYPAHARDNSSAPGLMNYIVSAPLRVYHDGDMGQLRVGAIRSDDPPGSIVFVTVSGYLIDLP